MAITKKTNVARFFVLFLAAAFALFLLACGEADISGASNNNSNSEDNTTETGGFKPLTLGISPGNDTTELGFNWYSSGSPADKVAQVRLMEEGAEEYTESDGTVISASSGYTAHKVKVTGLEPGSSYNYQVSNNGNDWSESYSVKIPPAGAFRFAAISDPQIVDRGRVDGSSRYPALSTFCADGWKETVRKLVDAEVCFIANMGDQVDNNQNTRNEPEYTSFFAPPELRNLPFAPAVGNHDAHTNFYNHFNLPNEQFIDEDIPSASVNTLLMGNYYYRYNNVLFVVLNTGVGNPSGRPAAMVYIDRFRQVLEAAKEAHAGKYDWLIVQHHKSTASVANHVADTDIQSLVEAGFETLMSEYDVNFVLAGHDHVYARSYPLEGMDNGKVSLPDKTQPGQDVTSGCTIAAAAGKPVYITFTTASGVKYYQVSADKTFKYNDSITNNSSYPYLGANADGSSTLVGSASYRQGILPVSNAVFVQPWIPSYCIVDVDSTSISFKTYPAGTASGINSGAEEGYSFNEAIPYDSITVTKE